ncbi:MAG: TetR/AcrR family transcriptional regulator [Jatrophihabitans sp.]|uniref:TetR/AcrR family transcriptional regulator n=1 Tax=Jatrophihabitans sp. TaxID=1932789 RepID=UPI0039164A49
MTALPNRDRRAERREDTRREILDAAWAVARQDGLENVTLRAVAERVGMRAPSLYSHFESKNAIYDAMFGQAWSEYLDQIEDLDASLPAAPRKALLFMLQTFVDFCTADLPRFQLMNLRVVTGFAPSPEAYAPSLRVMELFRRRAAALGAPNDEDVDLLAAAVGGLVDAQWSNDPGGTRYIRLLPRAIDALADDLGLPGPKLRRKR